MINHILIKAESTLGTFVTPDVTLPVKSWTFNAGQSRLMREETGAGRGTTAIEIGAYEPSGSFEAYATPALLPYLIKAAGFNTVTKSTPGGATNARNHVFLADDTAALKSLSVQGQYVGNGTTVTYNQRGVVINKLTVTFTAKEYVMVTGDYFCLEQRKAGDNFSNGNTSAATQSPAYPTPLEAFSFAKATLTYGGTISKDGTSKVFTQTSGTALTNVESYEVTFDQGITQQVFLSSYYAGRLKEGKRKITFTFTVDNETPSATFYDRMIAGTQEPLFILGQTNSYIESTTPYDFEIGLPKVDYGNVETGALSGSQEARSLTVSGEGIIEPVTDNDAVIRFKDANDTGY